MHLEELSGTSIYRSWQLNMHLSFVSSIGTRKESIVYRYSYSSTVSDYCTPKACHSQPLPFSEARSRPCKAYLSHYPPMSFMCQQRICLYNTPPWRCSIVCLAEMSEKCQRLVKIVISNDRFTHFVSALSTNPELLG